MEDWAWAYRRRSAWIVLFAAFWTGVSIHLSTPIQALTITTFACSLPVWCVFDARIHGKVFLWSFGWQLTWTWPLGMLVYLVWTRRSRGLVTYVVQGTAYVASVGAGMILGNLLL